MQDVVLVTIGTGVGSGIIIDGKIVVGRHGLAGEIGHIHVEDNESKQCNCGAYGCLEQVASATGIDTQKYNLLIAIIIAIIVVLAMNLVGSLLISALVVFPALASMCVFKSFLSVTVSSAIFSVFCTALGLFISILGGSPVGATIVCIDILAFFIFYLIGKMGH